MNASVELTAPGELGSEWVSDALIRYGPGRDQLGVEPRPGSCLTGCGPDSAAPSPNGTWWVFDVIKSRFVEFGVDGRVRRVVPLPVGAEGMSQIRVLDDGTVVGDRGGDQLVLVRGDDVSVLSRPAQEQRDGVLSVFADDGLSVFGEDEAHRVHRIGIEAERLTDDVASATLRDGTPYSATVADSAIVVTFGAGPDLTVHLALTSDGRPVANPAFSQAVEAAGVTLLVAGNDWRGGAVTRLVRVDRRGMVTDETAPDPFPSAQSFLPSLRTTASGVSALSWADARGLHLYHRLREPAPHLPPPDLVAIAPASSVGPAAGICAPATSGIVSFVELGPDGVPQPRCAHVLGHQQLRVTNASWFTRYVRLGHHELALGPGETKEIRERFDHYLAPGLHSGVVYGSGGSFELIVD